MRLRASRGGRLADVLGFHDGFTEGAADRRLTRWISAVLVVALVSTEAPTSASVAASGGSGAAQARRVSADTLFVAVSCGPVWRLQLARARPIGGVPGLAKAGVGLKWPTRFQATVRSTS